MNTTHIIKVDSLRPARSRAEERRQRLHTVRSVLLACGHGATTHKSRAVIGGDVDCVSCYLDNPMA
jgi:hypothetical protein